MMRVALLTALMLAILPAPALAQGPFFFGPFAPPQEDYGPGISVGGAGLARVTAPAQLTEESVSEAVDAVRPRAVARAVGDARRRAEAIAGALGLSLGSAEAVELGGGFPEREPCRSSRRTLSRNEIMGCSPLRRHTHTLHTHASARRRATVHSRA